MNDEAKEAATDKGRTLWDVLTLALFNKTIWRLLGVAVPLCLVLAYFDLINIQYDNGFKVRVGADPNIKKIEEEKRAREDEERTYQAKRLDSLKYIEKKFVMIQGNWADFVMGDAKNVNDRCRGSKIGVEYQIRFESYDAQRGTGRSTMRVIRSMDNRLSNSQAEDCVFQLLGQAIEVRRSEEPDDRGYYRVTLPDLLFDGTFSFYPEVSDQTFAQKDTGQINLSNMIGASYFQRDCSRDCIEPKVVVELVSEETLIYRGPIIFVGDKNDGTTNVTMERSEPAPRLR